MIGIIDYGLGNLASVKNAFDSIDIKSEIIKKPNEVSSCSKLILPGVGAFSLAMENLNNFGWSNAIETHYKKGKWILGICLGMQLFLNWGFESGKTQGLNLVDGKVSKLYKKNKKIKLPHVGWNNLDLKKKDIKILNNINLKSDFILFILLNVS